MKFRQPQKCWNSEMHNAHVEMVDAEFGLSLVFCYSVDSWHCWQVSFFPTGWKVTLANCKPFGPCMPPILNVIFFIACNKNGSYDCDYNKMTLPRPTTATHMLSLLSRRQKQSTKPTFWWQYHWRLRHARWVPSCIFVSFRCRRPECSCEEDK